MSLNPINIEDSNLPIQQYDLIKKEEENIINVTLCYASLMNRFFDTICYHEHNNIELLYVQSGSCFIYIGKDKFHLHRGDIFIIDKNQLHYEQKAEDFDVSIYYLGILENSHNEQTIISFLNADKQPLIKVSQLKSTIEPIIKELFYEAKMELPYFQQNVSCLLTSLLLFLARLNNKFDNFYKDISKHCKDIIRYIETNYYKDCTLETLSTELHLSKYYISHIFKKQLSISPVNYIINKRISEAKKLLISTNFPITKIASLVGYPDSLYFSRLFKQKSGYSPQKYRKTYKLSTT